MTFYTKQGGRRHGYVPGRDPLVDDVMRGWQSRYCSFSDVSVFVSTFNVNGKSPPGRIDGWLDDAPIADVYAIGLQEMDLTVGTYIIENTKKMDEWLECMRRSLPREAHFELVTSCRLVGIVLAVFRRLETANAVRIGSVQRTILATGISLLGNVKLGNKGGAAASLRICDSMVCFVNCHLAAGMGELERRNQDFRDISQLTFPDGKGIYDHDVIVWCGDLNYRINAEQAGWSGDDVRSIASSAQFGKLFQYDQLREQLRLGRVFMGFNEPERISFRPTYKYDCGTSRWDTSEKARAPAWCDRVLWWTRDAETQIVQTAYESVEPVMVSDHKPVRARFQLTVRMMDQAKADAIHDEAVREADRRANEMLPQVQLSCTEVDFGEARFLEPVCRLITITNTGRSTVRWKLMQKPDGSVSAHWLQVTPPHFSIPIGQSCQISLTVVVDKRDSWTQCEQRDSLMQDILVLNLENGRDYFIPVSARYVPRVFGVPLQQLLAPPPAPKELLLIDFGEPSTASATVPNAPPNIPVPIHRLVSALRAFGPASLDLDSVVDHSMFIQIRNALESNQPADLTQLHGVTSFGLYSALLRLLDTLKEPLIPACRRGELLSFCHDACRLWSVVGQCPPSTQALLEYLTDWLRDFISAQPRAREQLSTWADVLFRDSSSSSASTQRLLVVQSLCAYGRDVAMFHTAR